MIERADSDGDGYVSFEDFYSILTKKNICMIYSFMNSFIILEIELFNLILKI